MKRRLKYYSKMGRAVFNEAIGAKIREARIRRGMTQEVLAAALGISRPSMVNIELGRQGVHAHLLFCMEQVLGCGMARLFPRGEHLAMVLFRQADKAEASLRRALKKQKKAGK